jgi:hypothetical protein
MGSQAAPVRRNFVAAMGSGVPDVPRETERLDPTDTGVMATRRLAPYVSEEEEGEYQRSGACNLCHVIFPLPPSPSLPSNSSTLRLIFLYRYIDQILGLMDDDESNSGPGPGDLEVYEKVVSFLSGNVEPTSDLDDVSLAYVQIPHLEMMEGDPLS